MIDVTFDMVKDILKKAINTNVIHYDSHDMYNEPTTRLFLLVGKHNYDYILLSPNDFLLAQVDIDLHNKVNDIPCRIKLDENVYNKIREYYIEDLDGCFASNDKNLVLFVDKKFTRCILGSY